MLGSGHFAVLFGLRWLRWWLCRSKSNQYETTSLVQIEGVNTKEDVAWYAGKRMAYIYKAKTKSSETRYRCIWGKVTRPHGNSGVVRAKFKSNLPPESMVSDAPSDLCDVLLPNWCSVLMLFLFECRGARSECSCTRAASKVRIHKHLIFSICLAG